jgi:transposase InsO family protein
LRYDFIRREKKAYPITVLCRVMKVSRSGFYNYLEYFQTRAESDPSHKALEERIRTIFKQSKSTYGSRRIMRKLKSEGHDIGRYRVRKLMRKLGLRAKTPRRFKVTTDSKHSYSVAPNLVDRQFCVDAPDKVWATDITYLWTMEGWSYLAVVMDLHSRQVVGWALDKHMRVQLTLNALAMAYWRRKPEPGLIHHSDRGIQYACDRYQEELVRHRMTPSMCRKGDCWDNAPVERFFRSLKYEHLLSCKLPTREAAERETLEYITFYNAYRLHSSLGYRSPMDFEKDNFLKAA